MKRALIFLLTTVLVLTLFSSIAVAYDTDSYMADILNSQLTEEEKERLINWEYGEKDGVPIVDFPVIKVYRGIYWGGDKSIDELVAYANENFDAEYSNLYGENFWIKETEIEQGMWSQAPTFLSDIKEMGRQVDYSGEMLDVTGVYCFYAGVYTGVAVYIETESENFVKYYERTAINCVPEIFTEAEFNNYAPKYDAYLKENSLDSININFKQYVEKVKSGEIVINEASNTESSTSSEETSAPSETASSADKTDTEESSNLPLIIGISVGVVVVIAIVVLVIIKKKK